MYQTLEAVFLEFRQKCSAARRIFNSLLGERALHRHRRGRGFESRSEPENFFQVSVQVVLRPHLHYDRYHSFAAMGQITFISSRCFDIPMKHCLSCLIYNTRKS